MSGIRNKIHPWLSAILMLALALAMLGTSVAHAAVLTTPAGLCGAAQFRFVFETSALSNASSTSLSNYDIFVTASAVAAGLTTFGATPVTWQVIGSTSSTSAISRLPASSPALYRLDGVKVASSGADFWDGSHINPINVTELGATTSDTVWTGMGADGSIPRNASRFFTLGSNVNNAVYGIAAATDSTWAFFTGAPNAGLRALYAVSNILTANVSCDAIAPAASPVQSPAANAAGWNNTDVTVTWNWADNPGGSGINALLCPATNLIAGEGASLSVMGTCADNVGNTGSKTVSGVKIDRTAPNTGITAPSGWNNTDVTLTLTPNDGLSGVSVTNFVLDGGAQQTGASIVISTEGIHTIEYWSVDVAGNTEAHHTASVKIDKTPPTISHSQLPLANGNGWNNSDVTVTFVCGDALSGLASCTAPQTVTSEGQLQLVTGSALDNAGNSANDPATVSIDKSAPTISASADRAPNADGWYNGDVLVSFTCADTLSGLENVTNSGIASCPPAQTLGEGANQSASGIASDAAGNSSASAAVGGINVDKTVPSISAAATTSPNGAGWYNGDVTVHFTCSDGGSGIPAGACPADQTLSAEGLAVDSIAQTVTDLAGNTSDPSNVVSVQIDKTAPTIDAFATASPNGANWYNSNVTVQFVCSDGGSGIPAGACPADQVLSAEGLAVASGAMTVTDAAGNVSAPSNVVTVQIDKTAPTLSPVVSPNPIILNGTAAVSSGAADALSGLASQSCGALVTNSVGAKSVNCTATDNAGNSNSATVAYKVIYRFDGFLQPINDTAHTTFCGNPCVASIFKGGSTVPVKFQLKDANGNVVQSASLPQWLTPVKGSSTSAAIDESIFSDPATSGTTYRWDSTGPQYIYNWGTKGFTTGFFWRIGVTLDDGQTYYVYIGLK